MAISVSDLKLARDVAAEIVATHSERYVPFFEILDAEIKRRERQLASVQDAYKRSRKSRAAKRRRKAGGSG